MTNHEKMVEFENLFYYFKTETLEQMGKELLQLIHDESEPKARLHYAQVFQRICMVLDEKETSK